MANESVKHKKDRNSCLWLAHLAIMLALGSSRGLHWYFILSVQCQMPNANANANGRWAFLPRPNVLLSPRKKVCVVCTRLTSRMNKMLSSSLSVISAMSDAKSLTMSKLHWEGYGHE